MDITQYRNPRQPRSTVREQKPAKRNAVYLLIAYFSIGLYSNAAVAEERTVPAKVCVCPLLDRAPELDGEVAGDPVWQEITPYEGFQELYSGLPGSRETVFRLGFTEEALYVGAICAEPKTDGIVADMADGEALWDEDSVEVFLALDAETELQFVANPIGNRTSPSTLGGWEAAGYIGQGQWSVEFRLPWEVVGAFPGEGETWGLNICRNILPEGERELTTWAPVENSFHDPRHFGELRFAGITGALHQQIQHRIAQRAVAPSLFVYSRPRSGLLLRSDTTEDRLVYSQGDHLLPRFSPNTLEVVFTSMEGGKAGVWRVRLGGVKERLCDGAQASWSSDGTRVVFIRDGRLVERTLDSGEERTLSPEGAPRPKYPTYLPDGSILFLDADTHNLWRIRDGGAELLAEAECRSAPDVSPDGRLVAYQDGAHVHALDLESGERLQLTQGPGMQAWPVWGAKGESLCYLQALSVHEELWDLYQVELAEPGKPRRILRQVFAGFDWNGARPAPIATVSVPGGALRLQDSDADRTLQVSNDWFHLALAEGGTASLAFGADDTDELKSVLGLELGDAEHFVLQGWEVAEQEAQRITLRLCYATSPGAQATLLVDIWACAPILTMRAEPEDAAIRIKADLRYVVAPDRFANDLVIDSFEAASSTLIPLPDTPLVLGSVWGSDTMLALVCPEAGQPVDVCRGMSRSRLDGLRVAPEGGCVHLGVLSGERLWQRPKVRCDASQQTWQVKWHKPFQAQWRFSASVAGNTHASMWNEDVTAKSVRDVLEIDAPLPGKPERALLYLWGRDLNTPLRYWTPEDVLLTTLGIGGYVERLDLAGLRGYRSGEPHVALPELSTRPPGWRPWLSHQEKEGFGILEIMAGVFCADTPGTRSFLTHLGNDAISLIRGLDTRIAEYERFFDAQRSFCGEHQDMSTSTAIEAALRDCRETSRTELDEAKQALEALLGILGRKGDFICATSEFGTFSGRCRALLAERKNILLALRDSVEGIRDAAGQAIVAGTGSPAYFEELRKRTRGVLRNRHYLEGDWRGERPLSMGGLP